MIVSEYDTTRPDDAITGFHLDVLVQHITFRKIHHNICHVPVRFSGKLMFVHPCCRRNLLFEREQLRQCFEDKPIHSKGLISDAEYKWSRQLLVL